MTFVYILIGVVIGAVVADLNTYIFLKKNNLLGEFYSKLRK